MATATLSYDELQAQIKKLTEQAEAVKQTEIESVLGDMKAKIAKYGLTADQLGFTATSTAKKAKKTSPSQDKEVMYKNGDLTWSGATRGRKPAWVKEILDAGGDIEKYKVK